MPIDWGGKDDWELKFFPEPNNDNDNNDGNKKMNSNNSTKMDNNNDSMHVNFNLTENRMVRIPFRCDKDISSL